MAWEKSLNKFSKKALTETVRSASMPQVEESEGHYYKILRTLGKVLLDTAE
jgi:hypothetical protein